jgi:ATP-dependent exoDNAse (exonuclease V) beta subunit
MFSAHSTQVVNESLCLLYVAMTRAVRALFMFIAPSKTNQKTLPKMFSGMLRGALYGETLALPDTRLYEHGVPKWQSPTPDTSPLNASMVVDSEEAQTVDRPRLMIRLRDANRRRARGLERLRPSDDDVNPFTHLAQQLQSSRSQAMLRGSLLHAWLEQIEWLDDGGPDEALLRQVAKKFASTALDIDTEIQTFRGMLKLPQTQRILSRHGYDDRSRLGFSEACQAELQSSDITLRVLREHPFAIREHDAVVNGIVDRLILFCREGHVLAADILDFKADTLTVGDSAGMCKAISQYRSQLSTYQRSISRQFSLDSNCMTTHLLFLQLGECHRLEF